MTETLGERPSKKMQKIAKTLECLTFKEKVEVYEELFYLLKEDVEKTGTTGQRYAIGIIDDIYSSHFY